MGGECAINKIISGFQAGMIATGPMTLFMMGVQEELPAREKSPLPPATLTDETFEKLGIEFSSPEVKASLTMAAHFGYGAAMGVIYGILNQQTKDEVSDSEAALKGTLFGLAVWVGSYWVMSPLVNYRASGPKMPLKRNLMMAAAHVIWGASLGYAENKLSMHGEEMLDGDRKAPAAE